MDYITSDNYRQVKELVLKKHPVCATQLWVMDHIYEYIKSLPPGSVILEMGTFVGGSARLFALANPQITVHTIDVCQFENPQITPDQIFEYVKKVTDLPLSRKDLFAILRMHIEDLPNIISHVGSSTSLTLTDVDLVYIDADHSYNAVQKDLKHAWSMLKDDGWILGDDMNWEGVYNAVNEFSIEMDVPFLTYGKCFSMQKRPGKYRDQRMQYDWPNRAVFKNVSTPWLTKKD